MPTHTVENPTALTGAESTANRFSRRTLLKGAGAIAGASALAAVDGLRNRVPSIIIPRSTEARVDAPENARMVDIERTESLADRDPEEILGLWQRAGYLADFPNGFYPAPPINLSDKVPTSLSNISNPSGESSAPDLHVLTSKDDPNDYFVNFGILRELWQYEKGAYNFRFQGEYLGSRIVTVEKPKTREEVTDETMTDEERADRENADSFAGQIITVRVTFGDPRKGEVYQVPLDVALGWRSHGKYKSKDVSVGMTGFPNIGRDRPRVSTRAGLQLRPLEEVIKDLGVIEKPLILDIAAGVNFSFNDSYPRQARDADFPPSFYAYAKEISENQAVICYRLDDIALEVAKNQGNVLRKPGEESYKEIDPEVHFHRRTELEKKLKALPNARKAQDEEIMSFDDFIKLPKAEILFGVVVDQVPLENR